MHFNCKLHSMDFSSDKVVEIILQKPDNFHFTPGQYVNIVIGSDFFLPFSIASSNNENYLSFHLNNNPDSWSYKRITEQLYCHESLTITSPKGKFHFDNDGSPLVLIAGGSGFSPCFSILKSIMQDYSNKSVSLYWFISRNSDCYAYDFLQRAEKTIKRFRYELIVSNGIEEMISPGERIISKENICSSQVFASGPPGLVRSIFDTFSIRGVDSSLCYTDSF